MNIIIVTIYYLLLVICYVLIKKILVSESRFRYSYIRQYKPSLRTHRYITETPVIFLGLHDLTEVYVF